MRLTTNQKAMLGQIASRTRRGRGGYPIARCFGGHRFRTFGSLLDRGLVLVTGYGKSAQRFVRATPAARQLFAACLMLALISTGCVAITAAPDGTRTVRTFGAATTTVDPSGAISTESQGVSDGLVGMVGGVVSAARDFALGFFGRAGASAEPTIIVNNPGPLPAAPPAH